MKFVTKFGTALLLIALMVSIVPAAGAQPAKAATCYWAQFIADVTVPDGTSFAANTAFKKTWRLKNIGTCAWNNTDVSLIFDSGEKMGAPTSVALPTTVAPGQTVDITVDMTAPSAAGHYFGYYKFKSNAGGVFGIGTTANKAFWVEINVNGSSGTGYDFTTNASSATWSSGAGALTFPGTDGNASGFAIKLDKPKLESGIESAQAGLLLAPNNVNNGYVQGIYPAFTVQSGDRFQATIGCESAATTCYVAYRLDYQIGNDAVKTFWTFREKYEGLTYNVNLNLSSLAGQNVKFILVTSAYGSPVGDRSLWVNPIISRVGGTTPPTITPTVTGTPPTPTSTSSATSTPNACDRAQFVADVTVPDGTSFAPGIGFTKTWRLKNIGTCTWTNYSLMFDSGEKMSGPDSALIPTTVAPGQTVDITVQLTSPTTAGTYRGYWKLKSNTSVPFGIGSAGTKSFWVEIKVSGTGTVPGTITRTPTAGTPSTPVTPATPIAGTSYDFVANVCAATWYSGAGQLPCPGTDGDAKGFVLITNPSKMENGTNDSRPGLITFPQNLNNGYIQGIYPSYKVKAGDKFRTIVNCENGATSCYVVFRLDYSAAGSSSIQTFWAFVEKYEGGVYTADIDLSSLAGQDVKFILSVLSAGSATGDRALWVAPIIYNASSVPAPSATPTVTTAPSSPTPTTTFSPTPTPTSTSTSTPTATATP
ncbi:MAG: NBR1-Ig-like domain-containing protein [Anaerolineales bacterium]